MEGFDMVAYIMGLDNSGSKVIIEGNVTCTDPNSDGNVVITED